MSWRSIWGFLPPFLRRVEPATPDDAANSPQEALAKALAEEISGTRTSVGLLKIRGAAHRVSPPSQDQADYYASDDRKRDLALVGVGYGVKKRHSEIWDEFEARLQSFPAAARKAGTVEGVKDELDRTGLTVAQFVELNLDDKRWQLLSLADQAGETEAEISHIFEKNEAWDPEVRWTRIYELRGDLFSFFVELSGNANYSKGELAALTAGVKPAFTRCYLKYPDGEVEVIT